MKLSNVLQGFGVAFGLALGSVAWAHSGHDGMGQMAVHHELPAAPGLSASGCWIRQLPSPVPSGGFLTVHNDGQDPAVLVGAHSDAYGQVMMHKTDESGGMSRMSMVSTITVPAGGQLAFKSGSYHLMLEKPRDGLHPGDHVDVVLDLQNKTQLTARCEIKPANTIAPANP